MFDRRMCPSLAFKCSSMSNNAVAIVTGGSRGIGNSILNKLINKGLSCIFIASSLQNVKNTIEKIHITHERQFVKGFAIDFSCWPEWPAKNIYPCLHLDNDGIKVLKKDSLLNYTATPNNKNNEYYLDLLVNCAGLTQTLPGMKIDDKEIQRIFNVNLMSAISMSRLCIRPMIRSKRKVAESKPMIINIASILGENKYLIPGTTIYSASKAALIQYTNVLSCEVKRFGISAYYISPGLIKETDMINRLPTETQEMLGQFLKNKSTTLEEIANSVWEQYQNKIVYKL